MKLYRSALTAGILALGVAACGDDVQVVDPPPPPPPALQVSMNPPSALIAEGGQADFAVAISGGAAGVEAMHTCASSNTGVASVTDTATGCRVTGVAPGNAAITATVTKGEQQATATAGIEVGEVVEAQVSIGAIPADPLTGQVAISVNLLRNDQTPTELRLKFDDVVVASQVFAVQAAPAGDAPAEQSTQVIVFNVDTADGEMGEDGVFVPRTPNGPFAVNVELFTAEGGIAPSATNSVQANVENDDRLEVIHLAGGNTAVNDGVRYFGGEDVTFRVQVWPYSGTDVGTIEVDAETDGGLGDVSLNGDAPGDGAEVEGAPFDFTAVYDDNRDAVEDDSGFDGHLIEVVAVSDADDVALDLGDFDIEDLEVHLDDTAPVVVGTNLAIETEEVEFGATTFPSGVYDPLGQFFRANGIFIVDGITDGGAGLASNGDYGTYEAIVDGDDDNPIEGVVGTNDLDELGDLNLQVEVVAAEDRVGNAVEDIEADMAGEELSDPFNTDFSLPEFSDVMPSGNWIFNGAGDGVFGNPESHLLFTLEDPDGADGEAGSQVDVLSVEILVENLTEETEATVNSASASVSIAGAPTWAVDIGESPGVGVGLLDGDYNVTVWGPDSSLEPNVAIATYSFTLDTTAPDLQLDNTPVNTATSANSVLRTISGTLDDLNGISMDESTVEVFSGTCAAPGAAVTVGTGPGEIDRNDIEIGEAFDEAFRHFKPAGVVIDTPETFCYIVTASDTALDNDGDDLPNFTTETTELVITWQP